MAGYVKIENGIVTEAIAAHSLNWCETVLGGTWVQADNAGIGMNYDGTGFYSQQPFPSWTLDKTTYQWVAPTPMPNDGSMYSWDEQLKAWEKING
jgi:hypothetical protein